MGLCVMEREWLSPSSVTADEVTQNCSEKIYAKFCPFTMAIEEHLDLNQFL